MSKRFITTILAGALAIASLSAQPARAGNEDLGRFLLGAATLVIIGTAIENSRNAQKREVVVQRHHQPRVIEAPRAKKQTAKPKARTRALLPEYCLRTVRSHKGPRSIYGKRCMKNNYRAFQRLPEQCKAIVRGPNGIRQGFRPACLYRAGFRG